MNEEELETLVEFSLECDDPSFAERILREMLRRNPDSLTAHFHLTRVYRRKGQFSRALLHGQRTLKINPEEPNASLNLALVYEELGNYQRAVFYYKKELKRDPLNAETLYNLGYLYFHKHRWSAAAECLEKCLQERFWFNREDTVYKLGYCYYKQNNLQKYIELYQEYLRTVPFSAWAAENLGNALVRSKDYKSGILWLKRGHRLNPTGSIAEAIFKARKKLIESEKAREMNQGRKG
ncbi:MAG: tetratricopeptide repeat protein [Verrucomicrobiota bacterium]